jgi:hypothetical protein
MGKKQKRKKQKNRKNKRKNCSAFHYGLIQWNTNQF